MAPWEGISNFFSQTICRGGIPNVAFWEFLSTTLGGRCIRSLLFLAPDDVLVHSANTFIVGKNKLEDVVAMVRKYPLWNEYWADKDAKVGQITAPMYATASYSSGLHTEGSYRGFFLSSSKEKW
jgi:predicted acyl esterase